ncbi:protein phosphatase 2C domain-containing protein [Cobetia marina]|uniref:Protein phosphatase 2C domain-containing protein n=1 Tax=Cobetia marina TaxID=28258 RepID=A0ABU9GAZ4_COBMA
MVIEYYSASEIGPRKTNEDYVDCWRTSSDGVVACIADGLGGMGGGDVASKIAINIFKASLDDKVVDIESMRGAAISAHKAILEEQKSNISSRMASTLTALYLDDQGIIGVHCGDSRAVIARGNGIKRLTKDHSEGQRLFDANKLSKEEFYNYPRKHILESALGQHKDPVIDSIKFDLALGDRVILTTDGVYNSVYLKKMRYFCDVSQTPKSLVNNVFDLVRDSKPSDNYSMIALYVE